MPLRAQRPAPPPPGGGIQHMKANLNSSLRKTTPSDSNNNRQNMVFSRPTVIRPCTTTNKPLKKKPPPRPAPPKNYQTSKQAADNLTLSTPDLLADLRDIFSCPSHTTGNQKLATSSNQKPPPAFPRKYSQASASFPFRPSKKYQAPVPSASKNHSGEVSLIDFDSPVVTARVTPSNMVAMAAVANQHKSLLDWGTEPQRSSLHIPKSSSFDLLLSNSPSTCPAPVLNTHASFSSHNITSAMQNPTTGLLQQRAASFASQHKATVVNWGASSVKEQISIREFSPPEPKFPPPPPPPTIDAIEQAPMIDIVTALFDFTAENADELSLRVGDRIEVEEKQNADWWTGRCGNKRGVFPAAFVETQGTTKLESHHDQTDSSDGCFAKAVYTFVAEQSTDLFFQEGDVVQVLYRINQDWLFGSCQGRQGQFPTDFVQKIKSTAIVPSSKIVCRVLYAFKAENAEELNLREGDRIVILEKSSADWWKGKLENDASGREGLFPAAFVETL